MKLSRRVNMQGWRCCTVFGALLVGFCGCFGIFQKRARRVCGRCDLRPGLRFLDFSKRGNVALVSAIKSGFGTAF